METLKNIKNLQLDSRKINPGDCFIALKGSNVDGNDYIDVAIKNGASLILSDSIKNRKDVKYIPELKKNISLIAKDFFNNDLSSIFTIGITGTNGKTTTSYLINQILNNIHIKSGLIGTIGYGITPPFHETELTTSDPITVQKQISDLLNENVKNIVMEVSSHALEQHRVSSINFDIGIFTNLSPDHLDYHKNMKSYWEAKKKLFNQTKQAIINIDDEYGKTLNIANSITYSIKEKADFYLEGIDYKSKTANLIYKNKTYFITLPFIEDFNLENLLAAIAASFIITKDLPGVLNVISNLTLPLGRANFIPGNKINASVIIDYAHTPDALKRLLINSKKHTKGKVWCIFGCGGNRDKPKRPKMAEIAQKFSDYVIITSDNPRDECIEDIVRDMIYNLKHQQNIKIEHDRKRAIEMGLELASPEDIVVIAGKGHETYQIIGSKKFEFSDFNVVNGFKENYVQVIS